MRDFVPLPVRPATGTVQWIDHYVATTEDVPRWAAFHAHVLGAVTLPDPAGTLPGVFQQIGAIRHGGFRARLPIPPTFGIGRGLPRYGYYIDAVDIEAHVRRLDAAGAIRGAPLRTAYAGDPGVAIPWQDPDGNQFEFWAPDVMPDGAMAHAGPVRVGRVSHGVFESRDLARTAAFFARYCELEPIRNAHVAPDVLALRLAAGGRLIFRRVDKLGGRTTGMGLRDAHTALLVHEEAFFPNYQRLWADLPEWDFDPAAGQPIVDGPSLPARTVLHPSKPGRAFHALARRGDDFFDWDTNMFHFYGGRPDDASFATYQGRSVETYMSELERNLRKDCSDGHP
jgi:predicted enzyme related to lactoylglutathione lyase